MTASERQSAIAELYQERAQLLMQVKAIEGDIAAMEVGVMDDLAGQLLDPRMADYFAEPLAEERF